MVTGCCFVGTSVGGLRPQAFVASELESFWHISRFPGDLSDLAQLSVLRSSCIITGAFVSFRRTLYRHRLGYEVQVKKKLNLLKLMAYILNKDY